MRLLVTQYSLLGSSVNYFAQQAHKLRGGRIVKGRTFTQSKIEWIH